MKKLLIVLSVLLVASFALYADRTSAHKGVTEVVAISDPLLSNLAKVDSDNNLQVGKVFHTGKVFADGYINTADTACTLYSMYLESTTAGDYAIVYDGCPSGAYGTFMFEVSVGVAHTPDRYTIPGGLYFANECYVDLHCTGTADYIVSAMYNETD